MLDQLAGSLLDLEDWSYQLAGDTVAVAVEQESHGWENQREDQTGELSVAEVGAMTVPG